MHVNQAEKAEELIAALGVLGRAQELGAGDDELARLAARVQKAERAFRTVLQPAR